MSNPQKRTTTYLISLTLVKVEALSEDEEEEEGEGTPTTTTTTTATPALLGREEVDGSAAEKAGKPEKALVADACVDELVGGDTHREEEMGGVTPREEVIGEVTHREEEVGGVTHREEDVGGVTHREEDVAGVTHRENEVGGGATQREEEVGGATHREKEVGGGATHREEEVGGATHREEEVGGATRREEEKGGATHREEEKGGATHREEEKGGATHREEEKGGATHREEEVEGVAHREEEKGGATRREEEKGGATRREEEKGGATRRQDEVMGGATHREEEVGGEDTVVQKEEQQLVQRREDQQQEVQPRGSSPVQEDRDDKPKMRQSRGGKPPKDGAFVGRSKKKGSFVPPPAVIKDPMNKASSSSSSAGAPSPSLGGGVRREGGAGPRGSDGILRPKTELYGGPPPPMLFLKGQGGDVGGGGMDLTTTGRSRCSLPVSMMQEGGATELNAKRSRCSLPVSIPSPRPDLLMRSSHHTPHGSAGGGADTTVCWWDSPRDRRETGPPTKTLDHRRDRDPRLGDHQSPIVTAGTIGPYRASWADSDGGRGTLIRPGPHSISSGGFTGMMTRDGPGVGDKFKTVSVSHQPAPPPTVSVLQTSSRPPKKGKSLTLDNSDLHGVPDDPKTRGRDGGGTVQRAAGPPRDRKMLKFISGIFTKSTTAPPSGSPAERRSSEEEGACVTSPEWTFTQPCSPPRLDTVQELHLGVLGGLCSAKSALVHRYMTGSYVALENPDGGQYMKEVLIDGQSHLLIIREETGLPDVQFAGWVDAVILVFSLENEASFQEVYRNYNQLSVHRTITEIPFIVVGTQDKISSSNHRVIDDVRARQLCSDVRRCTYYETCATYGLNVNRVFTDAAQKILTAKKQAALLAACQSLPNSPSHSGGSTPVSGVFPGQASNGGQSSDYSSSLPSTPVISHREICNRTARGGGGDKLLDSPTPGGPAARSATRRRTSRFTGRRGSDTNRRSLDCKGDLGSGRSIPLKQGPLLKRSGSSLNKEWKKKYVTLCNNGVLSYYSSLNDYMQDAPGKEMDLLRVTVKVPGKRPPRAVAACGPHPAGLNGLVKDSHGAEGTSPDSAFEGVSSSSSTKDAGSVSPTTYRKKHRRKKSFNQKGDATIDDEENFDFLVVSSTGQTWHFEALSVEERDSWVQAIESEILASLQLCESSKNKACKNSHTEAVALQAIRNAKGNNFCVDCEAPNPTWASLNLGALICIECSGIHRNLGTHLSRVRSLDLDDLPREMLQVLSAIGNHTVNCIWEGRTLGHHKPLPHATREERESWIRAKYELRLFVAPLPPPGPASSPGDDSISLSGRLLLAVMEHNLPRLLLLLAHCTKEDINAAPTGAGLAGALSSNHPLAYRLPACPLHAACQQADVVMTQLLIWYGCDVRYRDAHGQTALTLARHAGSQECVNILLQYGCPNEPPLPPVLPYHHMEPPLPPVPPYHHMAPTASFNVAAASLTPPRLPHVARTPYTTTSSSHRSGGAATLIHVGSRRAMS